MATKSHIVLGEKKTNLCEELLSKQYENILQIKDTYRKWHITEQTYVMGNCPRAPFLSE